MTQASPAQEALTIGDVRRSAARGVEGPLREALATLGEPLQRMAEYHFGWTNTCGTVADSHERVLRRRPATIAFLVAGSDPAAWDRVRNVAVANTLMSGGLCIHDDLVDQDEIRYGRATVWKSFGAPATVRLGDALLALAFHTLNDAPLRTQTEIRNRMASCIETACGGQALERRIECARTTTLDEVLATYTGKTSAACYFFASGALGAGASAQRVQAAAALGAAFGMAFEFKNDFEALWVNPRTGFEDALSDLRQRKVTATVAYALHLSGSASAELAEYYNDTVVADTADLLRIRQLLEQCGARAWLEAQMAECTSAAMRLIPKAASSPHAAHLLESFVLDVCQAENPALSMGQTGIP
ncbi:polyprenyl synthetase IdsB_1 [Mycobacteroides abscessus subsp. abscessus]|nr:polyprenyl synthetase IdsB_1 [Mycobacteroides abscessus subsp. abscessus]